MNELARKKCVPCEGGVAPLTAEQVRPMLKGLAGWALDGRHDRQDLQVQELLRDDGVRERRRVGVAPRGPPSRHGREWGECQVTYVTHAINGLSENDFICAAKLDALFEI